MGISTQTITVDLSKQPTRPQVVRLGQGDKRGTTLVADIYENGVAYNLNGKTARFAMRAPDGASSYSVAASSYSNNKATFDIDETYAASIAGKTDTAYIEILSGSTVICSTSRITVIVLRSASQGLPVSGAYSDTLIEAISSAQSAASSANSAASNANTKATRAENAATAANNATQNANTAKDAANAAATAANTAAGSANTAAETANIAKDAANAAATAANTAAGSANAATSEANAAIEAMGDISELAVPEMTANIRGGAKVGGSTQVVDEKLEIKLSESSTGTSVATGSTSALRELQVHGKSVQDGTPTPDAPVPVQVVEGRNLLPNISSTNRTHSGVAFSVSNNRIAASGTSTAMAESNLITLDAPVTLEAGKQYTISLSGEYSVSGSSTLFVFYDENSTAIFNSGSQSNGIWTFMPTATMNLKHMRFRVNTAGATVSVDANIQLEAGTTATHYVPHGSIGIVIGDTATPIDLQRNTLASLPDGTRDELHIDSAGHVWIDKRIGRILTPTDVSNVNNLTQVTGGARWNIDVNGLASEEVPTGSTNGFCSHTPFSRTLGLGSLGSHVFTFGDKVYYIVEGDFTASTAVTWVNSHQMTIIYPVATPQTIDLGYIDPPVIPSGSVVTVSASLTPTFDLDCWTEHASEIPMQMHDWYDRLKEDIDDIVYGDLGVVPVSKGGTGATDAAGARASLGAASQTDLVALGGRLDAIGDYEVEHGVITYPSITANTYSDHAVVFAEAMSAIPTVVAAPTGAEDIYLDVRDITANGFTIRCHNRSSKLVADDASVSINSGSVVTIPFADYVNTDLLFVDIEGLDLVAGTDYTISDNIITLTRPITHSGTHVHLRRVRNAHGASVTPTVLWLAVVG